jgi:fumarylpyruvate hydrolase
MHEPSAALAADPGQWHFSTLLGELGQEALTEPAFGGTGEPMSTNTNTGRRDFLLTGAALGAAAAVTPLAAQAQAQSGGYVIPAPEATTLPVVGSAQRFPVRRIYCVGRNYLEHIRELGNDERQPPFFFAKHRDMIVQNGSTVFYPGLTRDYQHELELVVAMKSGGENIPREQALSHVYGYAVGLDMTRRDLQTASRQKEQPWEIGKSFEQCAPCSAVTPVERLGKHLSEGKIQLAVNGKMRQDGDLNLMIWNVPDIIMHLSTQVGLAAGDLIYTGTPAGVAAVVAGDKMVGTIDGLGELSITVAPARTARAG